MSKVYGELRTSQQVARSLGLTRATICLAVKTGRLVPDMKLPGVNGAYLFSLPAVRRWRGLPEPLFEEDLVAQK